jgi:diguanylate cyclase (GGDEF)-like protein
MPYRSFKTGLKHAGPVVIVASLGALASAAAWYAASQSDEARVRGVLELRAEWRARDLERKLQNSLASVEALAALARTQETVDGRLLRLFALQIRRPYDGTRRLGWAPRAVGELRSSLAGPDGTGVDARPAPRAERFPIEASAVFGGPSRVGVDLIRHSEDAGTAYRARDDGKTTSTPPQLFTGIGQLGVVVFSPVYDGGSIPQSVDERRSSLRGFAFGTFIVKEVLEAAIRDTPQLVETIRFEVPSAAQTAVAEYRPGEGIVAAPHDASPNPDGIRIARSFDVGGQRWITYFDFGREVVATLRSPAPTAWFVVGLLATGILVLFLLRERARKLHIERLVRKRTAELDDATERLASAIGNIPQGIALFDKERKLLVCNARYADLYHLPAHLARPGAAQADILQHRVDAGMYAVGHAETFVQHVLKASTGKTADRVDELQDGRTIAVCQRPTSDGGWVATHEDITERRRMEAQVEHMARHDALTDLPNRVLFKERLEQALARLPRSLNVAVLCLDLDRFKSVNDTLGHPVGDALLRGVADRLQACLPGTDTVARLGGDEFAIIQTGVDRPEMTSALADRILDALAAPHEIDGHSVIAGTSIGIAMAPGDADDADQLLKCADVALYRAKSDGRNVYRFFEPGMDAHLHARRALELHLRQALGLGQFELYYQPLVNLERDRISGFEALLRWRHPERGMVSPAEFIPVAEDVGIIVPIGEWVLREACREAARWPDRLTVAVNVSPAQFKTKKLKQSVISALAHSGLHASRLELEITESVLIQDGELVKATLHEIRALGVRISLDDFGTGYSSLSYLSSFPFDKIKIDRSFVSELASTKQAGAIVRAVASLGATLGMSTTAEGVETEDQLERVRAEGCTEVQGYLFSGPRPAGDIPALLANNREQTRSAA